MTDRQGVEIDYSPQAAARIIALTVVAEGESIVLNAAVEHWALQRFMLESAR